MEFNQIVSQYEKSQYYGASEDQDIAKNMKNSGYYISNLLRLDPLEEVSENTKDLITRIKDNLNFPLATHQVFIDSMYDLINRIELKVSQLREYREILEQKVDLKQKQVNEFNYYSKKIALQDEIHDNYKSLYSNFELLKISTQDLVFK